MLCVNRQCQEVCPALPSQEKRHGKRFAQEILHCLGFRRGPQGRRSTVQRTLRPWAAYGHSDGVGRLCSRLLLCRCRRLWMDMDLGFLMQWQTAIPIVGRSFVLLRGIRLCIFVPGKTLFFEEKFYRFSDYLCKSPQMLERLVISSISGILRFGRYPAYHGISEPHLALKSSKTVVETAAYYRPCWSATK